MIKNIMQYINDLCHTISYSTIDDFIWIYAPLIVVTGLAAFIVGFTVLSFIL